MAQAASKVATVNRYGIKCPAGVVAEPNHKRPDGTFGVWFTFTGSALWHYVLTPRGGPLCGNPHAGRPVMAVRATVGAKLVCCPDCKAAANARWK